MRDEASQAFWKSEANGSRTILFGFGGRKPHLPEVAVNYLFTCRPVDCTNVFVPTLGRRQKVLFTGSVIAALRFVFRTPLLGGIGKLLSISNMCIMRIVGAVQLSS